MNNDETKCNANLMEDKKSNIIAVLSVFVIVIVIVIARVCLKLSKTFFLICGACIAAIFAVFACFFIRRQFTRSRRILETRLASEGLELRIEYSFLRKVAGVPVKFRYKELEEATDGFQTLVGRGASASVFKGILADGTAVAVKRMEGGIERGEKDFRSEVAAIANIQHINLVHLLGYCSAPSGQRFLVYEFIKNGSLDIWIFSQKGSNNSTKGGILTWELRYMIAIDVARALSYLHHDCRSRILHLDVKPENILVDENYRALVSDFGLSKLMRKEESRLLTTIRGTRGYLAPEWILELGVSEKSDIYSYGMVLLEMVGGQRNVTQIEQGNGIENMGKKKFQYFPKIMKEKLKAGRLMEAVDPRLGVIDEGELKRMVFVALWCIQEKARLRPSMAQVVEMLEGHLPVEEPPETQMVMTDLLSIGDEGDGNDEDSVRAHDKSSMQNGQYIRLTVGFLRHLLVQLACPPIYLAGSPDDANACLKIASFLLELIFCFSVIS